MVGSTAAESPGPVIAVGAVDDHRMPGDSSRAQELLRAFGASAVVVESSAELTWAEVAAA